MSRRLSVEDLLAGASTTHSVDVPAGLLTPASGSNGGAASAGADTGLPAGHVVLRPLTLRDVQRLARASREQHVLASVLMVQQALVEPALTVEQVGGLSAGLVQFLLAQVNRISGLDVDEDELERAVRAPVARACFILGRAFGWSPAECSELTVGQVLLYLEMIAREGEGAPEVTRP